CSDFLVKSGLIHRCLQFNQAEISGYWHPSGADMPLSGDLGKGFHWRKQAVQGKISRFTYK
ncbi:hypothetical protein, partial [Thiolapillus sp.]|uniref:hypothetical protein n=1 Tax=Thiolapillus sp. TaxID=2017437 RepID=UPI0025EC272A